MVVHRFGLDEKLVFLGKDDKLFGVGLKADQSTPQEILSCGTRPRPWELQAQRRQDVTSVHITGTAQEALLNDRFGFECCSIALLWKLDWSRTSK